MKPAARHLLFSLLVLLLLAPSERAVANIVGSDFQSFNPTSDGLDFVTVQSVRPLPPGYFNIGVFGDYAFNTLPPALNPNGSKFRANNKLLSSDIHFAIGLLKNWEAGFNIAGILAQSVDDQRFSNYFLKNGLSDLRANTKYRLSGAGNEGTALNFTVDYPLVVNDPFYGGGNPTSYDAELIWQTVLGRIQWGLNGGFRFRTPGSKIANSGYEPVGNQWIASTALAYNLPASNWTVIGELFSSVPTAGSDSYSASDLTAVEALVGTKYWGFKKLAVHSGMTTALMHGISSPDFRFYVGINWYPFQIWGADAAQKSPPPTMPPKPPTEIAASEFEEPPPVSVSNPTDLSIFDKEPNAHVEHFIVQNINFDTGSWVIPPAFTGYLDRFADYLKRGRPLERVTIFGHTDSQGTAIYNQELSTKRAEEVKTYLAQRHGIEAEKIVTLGMGFSVPIAPNETPEGRSRNRRVEFRVER